MTQPLPAGTPVIDTANGGESGIVIRYRGKHNGEHWYEVRFGLVAAYRNASSLVPVTKGASLADLLLRARSSPAALGRAMTTRKIVMGMHDLVYSLGATKTRMLPYQYKPLLKLLQSHARRILVADEVGLGKTIEAGFVIMETLARHPHARVVIVCPTGLRSKWCKELRRRFGLAFDVLDRETALRRIAKGEDAPEEAALRAVVSYETIRGAEFLEAIDDQEGPDLVVVDEAHRTRNSGTATARSVHRLTAASRWAVYLTATPIQTSDEDLFTLLHALNPTEFPTVWSFRERARINRFVVQAEAAVRRPGLEGLREAREALADATREPGHAVLTRSAYYGEAVDAIQRAIDEDNGLDQATRVRRRVDLQARLFDLNLLSPFYTRTRRRHVHTEFAERRVQSLRQPMTDYERTVYERLQEAIFHEYRQSHGSAVARLVLVSYQMQLASSISGAVRNIKRKIGTAFTAEEDEADELPALAQVDLDGATGEQPRFTRVADALEGIDVERLEREDSKWTRLKEILDGLDAQARSEGRPAPKAIIFSFYRASLDLLERKLTAAGIGYRRIDGSVPHDPDNEERDEKGKRIGEFEKDPDVRLLIASQVGSEGLDLQFANTVVNWDLPWNPMVVEQRIGRVDRLGQKSTFVYAFNIVLAGTVEDRVLARLYERLHVFQEHIGECEQVLGDALGQLHREIFEGKLRPDQEAARLAQAELAVATNVQQNEALQREMDSLVGQEQFLIDRVGELKRTGRYISPEELEQFVIQRLQEIDRDSVLARRPDGVTWSFRAGAQFRRMADDARPKGDMQWLRFSNATRDGAVNLTFAAEDQDGGSGPALVHAMHPLVRTLVHGIRTDVKGQLVAFEGLVATDRIPAGRYMLAAAATTDAANVVGPSILASAMRIDGGATLPPDLADELLNQVTIGGRPRHAAKDVDPSILQSAFETAEMSLIGRIAEFGSNLAQRERARRTRIRTQIDVEAAHESEPVQQRIAAIEAGNANAQILPILRAKLEKIQATRRRRIEELAGDAEPSIGGSTFAAGVVEVVPEIQGDEWQARHS